MRSITAAMIVAGYTQGWACESDWQVVPVSNVGWRIHRALEYRTPEQAKQHMA